MLPIWKLWAFLLFLLCPTHDPRLAVLKRERGNRWATHTVTHMQSSHTDWLRDMARRWLLESASICHAQNSVTKTHLFNVSGTRRLYSSAITLNSTHRKTSAMTYRKVGFKSVSQKSLQSNENVVFAFSCFVLINCEKRLSRILMHH